MTRDEYIRYRNQNDTPRIIWEGLVERGFQKDFALFLLEYHNYGVGPLKTFFESRILDEGDLKFQVTLVWFNSKLITVL